MKLIVVCAVLLSGCAQVAPLVQKGADLNDSALASAEFTLCRAISIGAWIRAYGNDKAKAEAWKTICAEQVTELPAQ